MTQNIVALTKGGSDTMNEKKKTINRDWDKDESKLENNYSFLSNYFITIAHSIDLLLYTKTICSIFAFLLKSKDDKIPWWNSHLGLILIFFTARMFKFYI